MKGILLTITLLFANYMMNACIIHTDIKPDSIVKMDGSMNGTGGNVDFNNDGIADCTFFWYKFSGFGWGMLISSNDTNTKYIVTGQNTLQLGERILTPLSINTNIDASVNWAGGQMGASVADSSESIFTGLGDKYIGVNFSINGNTHYGWILVAFDTAQGSGTLTVKEFAYENTPGEGIKAGDMGTSVDTVIVFGNNGKDSLEKFKTLQMKTTITPVNAYQKGLVWSVNDTSLASISTTGLLTAKDTGKIVVTITDTCSGKTDDTTISIISLPQSINNNQIFNDMITIYPNPVVNNLNISFGSVNIYQNVKLYSVHGRLISDHVVDTGSLTIDFSKLSEGIYYLVFANSATEAKYYYRILKH